MADTVRTIEPAEVPAWVDAMAVGFLTTMAEGFAEYHRDDLHLDRTWGAFDGDQVVGTLRSFPTEFTVPGPRLVPAAALTAVTVSPTHRRRGLLTEMITADLRASAARGEHVGILIASEYPIYGRFGYGAAAWSASYEIDAAAIGFRRPPVGTVELVDLGALRSEAPLLYDRFRVEQAGSIEREPRWWDRVLHQVPVPGAEVPRGFNALYRAPDGQPEGYVRYTAEQKTKDMRPRGELTVVELLATTPDAYEGLWRFCCGVDLVSTIHAGDRPADEALPWFVTDARHVRQTGRFDFIWVRVLDTPNALAGRRYATDGSLVLEITDPLGLAAGRYLLEGGPGGAACGPTARPADLTVPVDALGSLYAGGVAASTLADAGRLNVHAPAAVDRADVMFRAAIAPWCSTWF
jgi:predicted acetyltransferase